MELIAYLVPYGLEWLNLLVRWLHVITGIAWIGASFYFVWLDNSIRPPARAACRPLAIPRLANLAIQETGGPPNIISKNT